MLAFVQLLLAGCQALGVHGSPHFQGPRAGRAYCLDFICLGMSRGSAWSSRIESLMGKHVHIELLCICLFLLLFNTPLLPAWTIRGPSLYPGVCGDPG
ncbi:hypothetical protein V8C40DRAFT_232794 [Trichoderma camerunense]